MPNCAVNGEYSSRVVLTGFGFDEIYSWRDLFLLTFNFDGFSSFGNFLTNHDSRIFSEFVYETKTEEM